MATALIGHTGFVGGTLARAHRFDAHYNSRNSRDMAGHSFDMVVCAGLSAAKWLANRDPAADWAAIAALVEVLRQVTARRFVLISTIDVYPEPVDVDETSTIDEASGHAYGRHRLRFERFVTDRFARVHVVRLPALFGAGLKKNILFDLLHDQMLDAINPRSRFQWYGLAGLWRHIQAIIDRELRLINLVTEPIATEEILDRYFPDKHIGGTAPAANYDVGSCHAQLFGAKGRYLKGKSAVLDDMDDFIRASRAEAMA
jgi:hypothetical protein